MNLRTLLRSFAGGEISPEMFGRLDLDKFQTGLKTCRNFIVLPHGPVRFRNGTGFILSQKHADKTARVIEFAYSTDQTYAIELGDQYIRFHTQGGTLLEAADVVTGVTQANPGVVTSVAHGFSNGDTIYLSDFTGGMTELNGRYVKAANVTANTFDLQDLFGNAIDTSAMSAYSSGGTAARVYEIASPYLEADLLDLTYVQSADVLTITHPSYAPRELRRLSAVSWSLTTISFVPVISAPTGINVVATVGAGAVTYSYVVTAIDEDTLDESVASASDSITNNLATSGNKNTISWSAVSGALRYNVFKERNGLYGYIGQTDGVSFVDENITADVTRTPPESQNPFSGANNYPGCVSYFEQRRVFAGSNNEPQTARLTRSATESNLNYSIPAQDNDAITLRLKARQVNRIRHILPLADLILLTTNGEWRIWAQNSDAITPASVSARPQAFNGAGLPQPVLTGSAALYVRNQSARIYELQYTWEQNSYKSDDVSIMAPHMFDGYSITQMALTRTPVPVVWALRSDGVLLGMTYMPAQRVWAWHRHDTDGLVESVAGVSESGADVLYMTVNRTINGVTMRYVERMEIAPPSDVLDADALISAFHVDAGLTYSGALTDTITGLWHLEGETVNVLADGVVHPRRVVTNGAITLAEEHEVVHVGLPIVGDLETLPMALEMEAFGQGRQKNVNKVYLRVYRSSGIKAGPSTSRLTEYKQRTSELPGTPPALVSDEIEITIGGVWQSGGHLAVRQDNPLPLTVLSMVLEASVA